MHSAPAEMDVESTPHASFSPRVSVGRILPIPNPPLIRRLHQNTTPAFPTTMMLYRITVRMHSAPAEMDVELAPHAMFSPRVSVRQMLPIQNPPLIRRLQHNSIPAVPTTMMLHRIVFQMHSALAEMDVELAPHASFSP